MAGFSMKRARMALLACTALSMGLAAPASAQPMGGKHGKAMAMCHHQMSRLSVTGTGEARIAPDMAVVQLGVTTRADSASEAMRSNSTQQRAVIDALKAADIAEKDIQTSGLSLSPVMDYSQDRAPTVNGYEANNMVSVRVSDIARLGEVLDAIVDAGANQINGIAFTRNDGTDAEDDARREAVKDARHKAEILAEAAGMRLGPVLTLSDAVTNEGPPRPMMRAAAAQAEAMPVQAGEVSMSAEVQMVFAMMGGDADCGPMKGGKDDGHGKKKAKHDGKRKGLPEGHPPVPPADEATAAPDAAAPEAQPMDAPAATTPLNPSDAPNPEGDAAADPAPGDLPPPLGTDTGTPEPQEPVVPLGGEPAPETAPEPEAAPSN